MFYYHFPAKEDIVLALGRESTRRLVEAFEARLSAGERAITLLGDVLESFARIAVAQPEVSRAFILTGLARIEALAADLARPSFSRLLAPQAPLQPLALPAPHRALSRGVASACWPGSLVPECR